jgi:nucleoside-diphosphate-sugar epimerase
MQEDPMTISKLNTMKVLITGGGGFLGSRLARTLLHRKHLSDRPLGELVLADLGPPATDLARDPTVRVFTGALIDQCDALRHENFDVVFHLAAAVSAECEANFDLGLRSNVDTTRALLDALREAGRPRFVFSSSVAVFGGDADLPMPRVIHDDTLPVPQSSYGIQKFICEQLVADYSRRGFIDGRSVRLMTVTVRPGRPNAAASSFLSSIVREPLNGQRAVCPVPPETLVAVASPQRTIEGLIMAAEASPDAWGSRTAVNLPGLTVRVSEMLDALEAVAGRAARERVRFEEDPAVARLMLGWAAIFESARARRLGLSADHDFISIIRQYQKEQAAPPAPKGI